MKSESQGNFLGLSTFLPFKSSDNPELKVLSGPIKNDTIPGAFKFCLLSMLRSISLEATYSQS